MMDCACNFSHWVRTKSSIDQCIRLQTPNWSSLWKTQKRALLVKNKGIQVLHHSARPHGVLEGQRKLRSLKLVVPYLSDKAQICSILLHFSQSPIFYVLNSEQEVNIEAHHFFSLKNKCHSGHNYITWIGFQYLYH